jgi:uncharacterized protein
MQTKHLSSAFEVKSMDETTGVFEGYASVFGNKDTAGDVIVKGAFSRFLGQMGDPVKSVKLLWQHERTNPIGVWKELREDDIGLFGVGKLLIEHVQKAREAYALLKEGALDGLSIGFRVMPGGESLGKDGLTYVTDIDLKETSLVTFPANTLATVTNVKSIQDIKTLRDFEMRLREAGVSRSEATALANIAAKGLCQREADETKNLAKALDSLNQLLKKGMN